MNDEGIFRPLAQNQLPINREIADSLLGSTKQGFLEYSNEAGITDHIKLVLWDALNILQLENLRISPEHYMAGTRSDILIIWGKLGTPVGAIEVKIPNNDLEADATHPMSNEIFHGQLFDYLAILRYTYGVRHPFGIATTYQSWRFCWLPESDEVAASEVAPEPTITSPVPLKTFAVDRVPFMHTSKGGEKEAAESGGGKGKGKSTTTTNTTTTDAAPPQLPKVTLLGSALNEAGTRKLHGTKVLRYDHPQLPLFLISFLKKVAGSEIVERPSTKGALYPHITPEYFTIKALETTPQSKGLPSQEYHQLLSPQGTRAWSRGSRLGGLHRIWSHLRSQDLHQG